MKSRYSITFKSLRRIFRGFYCPDIVEVSYKSPLLLRQELQQCARYFQREGYSDWLHLELDEDAYVGYLFLDRNNCHAVGGCLFRKREYSNGQRYWHMHWIWLHPYVRNKGLLSENIELFNKRFGYWYPEPEHSKAMSAFIRKHNLKSPFELYYPKH